MIERGVDDGLVSIVETDKVIHTVETGIMKLVVEIESFGMSSDKFDEETRHHGGAHKNVNLTVAAHKLMKELRKMERVVTLPLTDDYGYYDDPQVGWSGA
nr:hypothetical protein [Tanacetum cinerariifolium]GEZ02346.1 hypothetical protein [Tanacetum cinerariifolium]